MFHGLGNVVFQEIGSESENGFLRLLQDGRRLEAPGNIPLAIVGLDGARSRHGDLPVNSIVFVYARRANDGDAGTKAEIVGMGAVMDRPEEWRPKAFSANGIMYICRLSPFVLFDRRPELESSIGDDDAHAKLVYEQLEDFEDMSRYQNVLKLRGRLPALEADAMTAEMLFEQGMDDTVLAFADAIEKVWSGNK